MKQELINSALDVLKEKQKKAREIANLNKEKALKDDNFSKLYHEYRGLISDVAMGKAEQKELKSVTKQLSERLKELKIGSITPKYSCSKCEDSGFINGKQCSCLKTEISKILIKNSGFSKLNDFKDSNFELFSNKTEIEKSYNLMQKWCNSSSNKNLVYLFGNTGTGKTFLTSCMAKEFIEQGRIIYTCTAFALSQDFLKFHKNFDDKQKTNIFENYLQAEILFIDDLGTEPIYNNISREYLYLLINERQNKGLRTIITSNLEPFDIQDKYDERIFSRIMDKEKAIVLKLDSKDIRLKK